MKKVLALVLCAVMALCAVPVAAETTTPSQTAPIKTRQYGEEQKLVADADGFVGEILYPAGEVEAIDTAVLEYASLTLSECHKQADTATADANGLKASLNMDYESFEYANRYVGVEFYGTYSLNGADTQYLFYAFNYDLEKETSPALYEIVSGEHLGKVAAMVQAKVVAEDITVLDKLDDGEINMTDLYQFVIRDDGIEWLFYGNTGIVGVLLTYEELDGYLCMLDPVATAAPEPTATPAPVLPTVQQKALVLHDNCNIRAAADKNSAVIATVNANTELDIVAANAVKGWHEVLYNGQVAYIYATLVLLASDQANLTAGWVTSNQLHIRAGAGTKTTILGTLKKGDRLDVIIRNASEGWDMVLYQGKVAYAFGKYVHIGDKAPAPETTPAPDKGPKSVEPDVESVTMMSVSTVGTCTTNGVVVRSMQNSKSDYYGKLKKGAQVYVQEDYGTWLKVFVPVSNDNGYVGFVHSKYFTITHPEVTVAQNDNPKVVIGR